MTTPTFETLVADASAIELAPLHGRFNPDLVPDLEYPDFTSAERIVAGVSPDCSWEVLRDGLMSAETSLLVYIYNLTGEAILDLLRERHGAGVTIRIMFDVNDTRDEERDKLKGLSDLGIEVAEAPSAGERSVFTVCHQKLVIVDGRRVLLGSANWGPTGYPPEPDPDDARGANREWVVRVDDEGLAAWYAALFDEDWELATRTLPLDAPFDEPIPGEPLEPVFLPMAAAPVPPPGPFERLELAPADDRDDPVTITPVVSPTNYAEAVGELLSSARRSICVQQQYILISGPMVDELLRRIAERRREGGVEVRIMVSPAFRKVGKKDNWELSVDALARHGLDDCLRAMNLRVFKHLHNKGVLVDDEAVVVSSTNWSENSVARAREAGLIIRSKRVGRYYREVFDGDWELGWPAATVKPNVAELFLEAAFVPGGFEPVPAAEFA